MGAPAADQLEAVRHGPGRTSLTSDMGRTKRSKSQHRSLTDSSGQDSSLVTDKCAVESEKKKSKKKAKKERSESVSSSIRDHFPVTARSVGTTVMADYESDSASVTGQEMQSVSVDISNADLLKEIRAMSQNMDKKIDQLDKEVEEMNGKMFELCQENNQLKKEIASLKKREESLSRIASEAKHQASLADRRVNELEQYTRRNNVRVFGVPEEDKETADQCEAKVLKIFHDKLGLRNITSQDMEATHRVGAKKNTK